MNELVKLILGLFTRTTESSSSSNKAPLNSSTSEVRSKGNYFIWNKGEKLKLSDHFTTAEFSCHCHYPNCKEQTISKDLIDRLEKIRLDVKQPLIITSAYRCSKYQGYLSATGVNTVVAKLSQHEVGNAADVVPRDEKNVRTDFLNVCAKYFKSIGLSDKFLHLDLRDDKERRWEY